MHYLLGVSEVSLILPPLRKLTDPPVPPPKLPILQNTGVRSKPNYCHQTCPRAYVATGFVPDFIPENPKIAVMISHPGKDDAVNCRPLSGGMGRFFWAAIGKNVGLKKDDVAILSALRCYTWKYPVGVEAKQAEKACRHWDHTKGLNGQAGEGLGSIVTWDPDLFVVTFGLDKMVEISAFLALAIEDFRKAVTFAERGYRPAVLLGTEVLNILAPWLDGGAKDWRGHWWEGTWPFRDDTILSTTSFPKVVPGYKKTFTRKAKGPSKKTEWIQENLF